MSNINLLPAKLDIFICRGTDWDSLVVTLKDQKTGTPLDLTGAAMRMQIRDSEGAVLDDLSSSNGRLVLGGTAGTIAFQGSTEAYAFAEGFYDALLTTAVSKHRVLFGGKVIVKSRVTEP